MVGLAGFEPRVAGWKMRANPLNYGCPQSEQFLLQICLKVNEKETGDGPRLE